MQALKVYNYFNFNQCYNLSESFFKFVKELFLMRKFLAALMLVSLMLCSVAYADDDVIKVGVFNCLTGQNAFGGQLELEGTQLAHSLKRKLNLSSLTTSPTR